METVYYSFSYTLTDIQCEGKTVGERIAYYRKKKKLSQQQLADLAGVSVCTIKRIENHKVTSNINTYNSIISALQISPDLIYNDYFRFISNDYSHWLKSYRKKNNLTQRELSKLLNIHVKTIMRLEQGKLFPR